MIGLDWIGLDFWREKKRRETVRRLTKESSTNERTNEDTFLLLFLGLFFGARDQSLSIKNREQNRERSPTLPRGTQRKEDFAPEERRAKTRGYVHMHVCMHTHTHTQRERFAHHVVSFLLFLRASCVKNNVRGSIPNYCMNFEYTIYHNLLIKLKTLLLLLLL